MPTFGELLKSHREAAGLTTGQLAKASGVSQQAISAYETGVNEPKWSVLQRLAKALGVPCTNFLEVADMPAAAAPVQAEPARKAKGKKKDK